jgi:putative membrane protein
MRTIFEALTASLLALTAAAAFAQPAVTNDAQIVGIILVANNVDIGAGELARSTSNNADVKEFAQLMITDHSAINKQATALVKKLKLKPEESQTSKGLKETGAVALKKLKGLKGKEFDIAYIDNELNYHQTVLDTLDKTLIPNAKNAELKDALLQARPAFETHLRHAKNMQASLK